MTRSDLAAMAKGIGAELGVARGDYSLELLERGQLERLYSIDCWSDHHDEKEYRLAVRRLVVHGERSVIVRETFADALAYFVDGFFDFIYIDGYAHTGQENGKTLRDWWPKLKPGGIFAGHDYDPQYPLTVQAVDEFAAEKGLELRLTDEENYRSWYLTKDSGALDAVARRCTVAGNGVAGTIRRTARKRIATGTAIASSAP